MKKMLVLAVGLFVLGAAFAAAQETAQTQAREKAQVQAELKAQAKDQAQTRAKSESRLRNRIRFIDENGDGINDFATDADGDGIPNCQDADWAKPQDGTGYQNRRGMGNGADSGESQAGHAYQRARDDDRDGVPNGQDPDWVRPQDGTGLKAQHRVGGPASSESGQAVKSGFGKGSFRAGAAGAARISGTGVCDGTGPKGTAQRKGRR
jgi:hypothetical protein